MKGIRIYCEGGGDGRASREMLTKGFREFLKELVTSARAHKIHFDVFACGSRRDAYEKFKTSLQTYQDSFNILLVDAEEPVIQSSWNHLKKRDSWDVLNSSEEQCHLMVQTMEAWLIADPKALKKFYGQGFSINALPKNPNVEQIEKDRLVSSLNNAIRQTLVKLLSNSK